jgi:hypothetical protein
MLPQIETPKYKLDLPSTGKTVEYRPFLVKEEKILLLAIESMKDKGNEDAISDATFQIIKNCTFNKIKPHQLPNFDIDYLFLNIRSRSRGEDINSSFICQNDVEGGEEGEVCGTSNDVHVNINDIAVEFPEEDNSKVMITEDVGIQFKYLSSGDLKKYGTEKSETDKMFKIIVDSIDYIFDEEKVYKGSETTKKELMNFIEALDESKFEVIRKFFDEQPTLKHTIKYECSKCGYKEDIVIEGLEAFFDLA